MTDQTVCAVTGCDNPSDGWFVCRACGADLDHDLSELCDWLLEDLDLVITGQTRYTTQSGKSSETPMMFNVKAAEVRGSIVIALDQSAATIAESNGWTRDYATAQGCAAWLSRSISAIRLHPEGGDIIDSLSGWVRDALLVVDRPAQRNYLGDCSAELEGVKCMTGRVYARSNQSEARCDVCGSTYDADFRRSALLDELADRLCGAAEIAKLSTYLGVTADRIQIRKRINQWHKRGQLERRNAETNAAGEDIPAVFKFGDALDLIYSDEQERAIRDAIRSVGAGK